MPVVDVCSAALKVCAALGPAEFVWGARLDSAAGDGVSPERNHGMGDVGSELIRRFLSAELTDPGAVPLLTQPPPSLPVEHPSAMSTHRDL